MGIKSNHTGTIHLSRTIDTNKLAIASSFESIVFTDFPVPATFNLALFDLSFEGDKGVVGWMQGDTYYVSTQRPGVKVVAPENCAGLFREFALRYLEASMLDVRHVKDLSHMFENCDSLVNIDGLAGWDTSHVTNMSYMFYGCKSLASLDPLANWDTSNVTNMCWLFCGCDSLENVDGLAGWDTSQVADMRFAFSSCASLSDLAGLAHWNTSNVMDMCGAFSSCTSLRTIQAISNWHFNSKCITSDLFCGLPLSTL
jgi:surface protein